MSENNLQRMRKGMRWAGRIIGFIATGFSVLIIIGNISLREFIYIVPLICITLVALLGLIISWWNGPVASILLFLSMVGLGIRNYYTNQIWMWIIIGIPYFVASILIFCSWRLSKK
jgi:hypothetical protein